MIRNLVYIASLLVLFFSSVPPTVFAQNNSGMYRYLTSDWVQNGDLLPEIYVTDMSGDGRFVVIESNKNIATVNPRNADGNREIFLFDVAQRHMFQITDTKSALVNPSGSSTTYSNIAVLIHNEDPTISNDGKWIALSSNATTSLETAPNGTNPGSFDGNASGNLQILQQDGNLEVWLYELPSVTTVNLDSGVTPPLVDLGDGTFTRVTNTRASRTPHRGTGPSENPPSSPPFIAVDNGRNSIDDAGLTVAFSSTRDIVPGGNPVADGNEEIFVYKRASQSFGQVTRTPLGPIFDPIYNSNPSISGDGSRVIFYSTGVNPVIGMTSGCNPEFNGEIYATDLTSSGNPTGSRKQITITAPTSFDPVNTFPGTYRSISRNGRYMTFVSSATFDVNSGSCETGGTPIGDDGYAMFLYDSENTSNPFKRIGPYDETDLQLLGGDGFRYARFTDYDVHGNPGSFVFTSRMNMCPDGTLPPAGCSIGLNPSSARPSQVYAAPLPGTSLELTKLSNSPLLGDNILNGLCVAGNSKSRLSCGFVGPQFGLSIDHLLTRHVEEDDVSAQTEFVTGAGGIPVSSIAGLNANMLAGGHYVSQIAPATQGYSWPVTASRTLPAPLQLNGVSVTVDGISAGITQVFPGKVNFIVPKGLSPGIKQVVINNNGVAIRSNLPIVSAAQPDVLTRYFDTPATYTIKSHGRAKILNVTDPNNPQYEPFRTLTQTPSGSQPTRLRLFLTGVESVPSNSISIQIGSVTIPQPNILTNAVVTDYPGVFTFDFVLPMSLDGAGNVPVVVTVNGVGSRPAATAARVNILENQPLATDLGIWRPGNGQWWVMSGQGTLYSVVAWGAPDDKPAPGDFDGDGKTDVSIFRPSTGEWWIINSSNGSSTVWNWGASGDIPAPADYDGDGKTDTALYRPSNGMWYIIQSSNQVAVYQPFGLTTDVPAPADYDGDGLADITVWRNSDTTFYSINSGSGTFQTIPFALSGPQPVSADYDGDGKADYATWGGGDSTWRILNSTTSQITSIQWGSFATDVPVHGDYDGDNKTDVAVWSSSGTNVGLWNILKSSNGQVRAQVWGQAGDIPVPARW